MSRTGQRHAEYQPRQERTGQPLAQVDCTGCGLKFVTAARSHTKCPDCGRNLRVHRSPVSRPAVVQRRVITAPPVRQKPAAVRQRVPFRLPPLVPAPVPTGDDEGYLLDGGRLVLGAWDGARLVPALVLPPAYLTRELAARDWLLRPHGQGICQVVRTWAAVADYPAASEECRRAAEHGPLCTKCFQALRTPA
jgi:predicted RNA-binding Zn-ribbon protein involved in translation (DUF1610 family)